MNTIENCNIHLQSFGNGVSYDSDAENTSFVEFSVLENPSVKIVDYRQNTLYAIHNIEDVEFYRYFNKKAKVLWKKDSTDFVTIYLYDIDFLDTSTHAIWICVGAENGFEIPIYDYELFECYEMSDNRLSFVAIYKRNV